MPGGDRTVRMKALWIQITAEYNALDVPKGNRFPCLRLKSFFNGKKSPKLKGKAAHIRAFVPVLDCIVQRVMVAADTHTHCDCEVLHEPLSNFVC